MNRRAVLTGARAGILLGVTGVVAWLTGSPFAFPGLGPTTDLVLPAAARFRRSME